MSSYNSSALHSNENSETKFQPYGFLLTGSCCRRHSSSGCGRGHSCDQSGLGTPTNNNEGSNFPTPRASPADISGSLAVDTEHGRALAEHLDFIVPPLITPIPDQELPTSTRVLFLGHLKFETTTAEVRWMIKKLCGVSPLRADIRGNGCCVVHLATDADVAAVRGLDRRVMFDHQGFWFARTAEAVDVLLDYVEKEMPKKKKSLHLPRDALVVEESRSSKHYRRTHHQQHATPNAGGNAHHNHQHPPQPKQPLLDPRMLLASSTTSSGSGLPVRAPMSPFALGSPAATRGFHDSPPDYVNPPSMASSHGTSPNCHPAPPPYSYVPAWDGSSSYGERSYRS